MSRDFRSDFPIFQRYPNLAYLDNAATTQSPKVILDKIDDFYSFSRSNIHRGVYDLANEASESYEAVRKQVASFLGSNDENTIAFTKGTTESINVVARSFVQPMLQKGDNIVTTIMEHHANLIPWQTICKEEQAELRMVAVNDRSDLDIDHLKSLLDGRTKLLAINHISNTLGTINPIKELIAIAHEQEVPVLIDAAQSAALYELDQSALKYDFLTFSGHKMFGPFGVGVLFVDEKFHDRVKPYNYGGGMIRQVSVHESSFLDYPFNLEAGTPNIAGVIGMGRAIDYVNALPRMELVTALDQLTAYGVSTLETIPELKIIGNPQKRSGIISFTIDDIHPHDVASFLNKDGIAVRAGMHCTQPLLAQMDLLATVRASFSIYNNKDEIDRLHQSLTELIDFWK